MELSWFCREDFRDRVVEIWNKPVTAHNSVQKWNRKLEALRRHLRGRAVHSNGAYKQQKNSLQQTVLNLDIAAENRLLSDGEREQLEQARENLTKLLMEEEFQYYQRAKTTDVLLGDNNTRYFQIVAQT